MSEPVINIPPTSSFSKRVFLSAENLIWFPELEIGYYPVRDDSIYDEKYFQNYISYEGTEIEKKLNSARVALVDKYLSPTELVLDVGIGSGAFIEHRGPPTVGTDINPTGIEWLEEKCCLFDEKKHSPTAITFWDVFEHLIDPTYFLDTVAPDFIFISAPVYASAEAILSSKHFKKEEHRWYWTRKGLLKLMERMDYECVEINDMESVIGRDSIETFVFRRKLS